MSAARYEIIRQLASGGMAEVLLARRTEDDAPEELVVLKRVLPHLCTEDAFLRMFAGEARIASLLRHPNIVSVLDVGEMDALPFIAMERLDGADLLRLLQQCVVRKQSLGPAVAMAIVAGAARGLGYAHRARTKDGRALKIIHRDVSPHNVFVTRDGGVKLLDFGIAKSASAVGYTMTGQVKGKVSYMSPEQIRAQTLDSRSDLWSLGVVLWEAMAGEKLFTRDNDGATLHAILNDEVPALRCPEAPGINDLIAAVLQRDVHQRVATAEEIATGLDGLLRGMGVSTPGRIVAARVASLVPALNPQVDAARPSTRRSSQQVVTFAVGPAMAASSPPAAQSSRGERVPSRPVVAARTVQGLRRPTVALPTGRSREPVASAPDPDELPTQMHSLPPADDLDETDSTVVERLPPGGLGIAVRGGDSGATTLQVQAPPPDPADDVAEDIDPMDPTDGSGPVDLYAAADARAWGVPVEARAEVEIEAPTIPAQPNPALARVRPRGLRGPDEAPRPVPVEPAVVLSASLPPMNIPVPVPVPVPATQRGTTSPLRQATVPAPRPAPVAAPVVVLSEPTAAAPRRTEVSEPPPSVAFGALPFADFANRADTLAASELSVALRSVAPRSTLRSVRAALMAIAATLVVAGITLLVVRFATQTPVPLVVLPTPPPPARSPVLPTRPSAPGVLAVAARGIPVAVPAAPALVAPPSRPVPVAVPVAVPAARPMVVSVAGPVHALLPARRSSARATASVVHPHTHTHGSDIMQPVPLLGPSTPAAPTATPADTPPAHHPSAHSHDIFQDLP